MIQMIRTQEVCLKYQAGQDIRTELVKEFNDLPEVKNYRASVPILDSALNAPDNKSGDIYVANRSGISGPSRSPSLTVGMRA